MKQLRITLSIETAFGTPLVGDTLFGQFCWSYHENFGNEALTERLAHYTENQPFLVISDAFPTAYLPLPTLPSYCWSASTDADRKILKKKTWISAELVEKTAFINWQSNAISDAELSASKTPFTLTAEQQHNTISRTTNTTGTGQFAPYSQSNIWYQQQQALDIYLIYDEAQIDKASIEKLLSQVGQFGYGRDASIGLGKFSIISSIEAAFPAQAQANACYTLARTAPQGLANIDVENSYYKYKTRFGRLGANHSTQGTPPFKKPLMLAETGAVYTLNQPLAFPFIGQGIIGHSAHQATVHQGYAPSIAIHFTTD